MVGTITVNATTNNGIVNLVKKIININGEEKEVKEYIDKNAYFYDESGNSQNAKCIEYNGENNFTICFLEDTKFEDIEVYLDDYNNFKDIFIK